MGTWEPSNRNYVSALRGYQSSLAGLQVAQMVKSVS